MIESSRNQVAASASVTWVLWRQRLPNQGWPLAGEDLYPTLVDKAAALGHRIIQCHPFVDGNKRTGHAAMELFLIYQWP